MGLVNSKRIRQRTTRVKDAHVLYDVKIEIFSNDHAGLSSITTEKFLET